MLLKGLHARKLRGKYLSNITNFSPALSRAAWRHYYYFVDRERYMKHPLDIET